MTAPRQLPPPAVHFTARTAELAELHRVAATGLVGPVVLCGPGGVGKTTLAVRWADDLRERFPDGQLYAALQGFSGEEPLDPSTVLGAFLRALGTPAAQVPVGLAEQAAAYRTLVAGRRLMVLLDDAFSAAQVRPLLAGPPATTIVTSRRRLVSLVGDGGRLIDVAPLAAAESVELLTRTIGADRVDREPQYAAELAGICGGLPIALCVAAGRLTLRPHMSMRSMVAALTDEGDRLATLTAAEPGPSSIFDTTYRSLTPSAAVLYRRLSLHPGPDFGVEAVTAVPVDLADPAGGRPGDGPLVELLEANLLQETAEDRFRFHDLLRLDAQQRCAAEDTERQRHATVRRIAEFYLSAAHRADLTVTPYRRRIDYAYLDDRAVRVPRFADRAAALSWLDRELVNLVHAGRAALDHGYAELAWRLCDVLWPVFLYHKHYRHRLEADTRGVEAARIWGNRWAEADMLKRLSRVSTKFGRLDEAERHIQLAIGRYQEIGDERGALDAEEALAWLHRDRDRPDLAEQTLVGVLAGYRRLADARTVGLACLHLGSLRVLLGRADEALPLLTEAEAVFDRLATVDPYNQARAWIALAAALVGTGDLERAEQLATRGHDRMSGLGSDHERAEALDVLGQVAHRRGNDDIARLHWSAAADIFAGLGLADRARSVRRAP
ncbi:NB-ARC domain-containing protein [Solwaraspora sp. WMMD937]|uniref:NB-ARC domain-containing protein n=1 Tax=Solwaraspora sp. WMMD937 TaxID=3016090 RepID=UPI00249B62FE|nr:NB-ARC domain-containing protein [Solwaraspora sp. WMMD937]WFE20518.1 NB-ARC domain-containing protein [Solwaraspora sp. WMMD937]